MSEKKKNEQIVGIAHGNIKISKKLNDEKMFSTPKGHGFAAERANHLYDKFTEGDFFGQGKVKHIGEDIDPQIGRIIKNGADRIVNGVEIQTKYCKTGSKCISECFENGKMKYTIDGGTKPMQIEVPSDKYNEALSAMENRIKRGEVPGVTDPKGAVNIVRKGHFTYAQTLNIAKAGTVESLVYDSVNGIIIAVPVFGLTALLTYANSIWQGDNHEVALRKTVYAGLNVAGTTFAISVLSSQISKSTLKTSVDAISGKVVDLLGKKATNLIASSINGGKQVSATAGKKLVTQYIGKDIITGTVTIVVLSAKDISDIFRGRISGEQLIKNVTNVTASVVGGTVGKIGGAAVGAAIGSAIAPGAGTVIGTKIGETVGTISGGIIAGKISSVATDQLIENDAEKLLRITEIAFGKLCRDYLVSAKEAEYIADRMNEVLDENTLKEMYQSLNSMEYACSVLEPIFEETVKSRAHIEIPSNIDMIKCLKSVLEELADKKEVTNTEMITCIHCKKSVHFHNTFCTGCGKKLKQSSTFQCSACGAEYIEKLNYCKQCGEKL